MEDELRKYKKKVKKLTKKLKYKNIMLNSLLSTLDRKGSKRRSGGSPCAKRIKKVGNSSEKNLDESTEPRVGEISEEKKAVPYSPRVQEAEEASDALFVLENNKNTKVDKLFKLNFKLDDYVEYTCSLFVPYICDDKRRYKISKNHALYIKTNKRGIHKHIFKGINTREIEKTWVLLYNMGTVADYGEICTIIHDLFLFVDDFEHVFYFSYALLHDKELKSDILSRTITMLLSYQALIMKETNKNAKIVTMIQNEVDLFVKFDVGEIYNAILEDDNLSEANISSIRIICSFMDWDWTFNHFVIRKLYKQFGNTKNPALLGYLGAVLMLGYKNFGLHESVQSILDVFKGLLQEDANELGLIACSYVKNLDFNFASEWFKNHFNDKKLYEEIFNAKTF